MKRSSTANDIVDTHMRQFATLSDEEIAAAVERAERGLRNARQAAAPSQGQPHAERMRSWHWGIPVAAAAAIILAVVTTPWTGGRDDVRGDTLRGGDAGRMLTLDDGSRVEMRAQSELSIERAADGLGIRLLAGDIIVNAAKQRDGHLYVHTKDMTIAVVGTVFLVRAGVDGSRVAVIEGEVSVREGGTETRLRPGEQVATSPVLAARPIRDDILWSRHADVHRAVIDSFMKGVAQSAAPLTPLARQADVTGAQTPGATAAALEFEEASIRPCDPDNLPAAVPGARGGGGGANAVYMTPGRFYALCMTPATLIRTAYGYFSVDQEVELGRLVNPEAPGRMLGASRGSVATYSDEDGRRVRGGPDWVRTEKYTIEAVARVGDGQDACIPVSIGGRAVTPLPGNANNPNRPCNTANATSMRGPMLRALLERRFGLKARIVTEQALAFSLVVAPGGLKMKEGVCTPEQTTSGVVSEEEWARRLMEPVRRSLDAARRGDATPGSCGRFGGLGMADNGPNRILVSEGARVPGLVRTLEGILGERVIDRTGIPDTSGFTYALEFVLDDRTRRNPYRAIATDLVQIADNPSSVPQAANLLTALEQQLGLRLEPAQVPRDYIVIDAIRRLDPN